MKKIISLLVLLTLSGSISSVCLASEPDKRLSTTEVFAVEDKTIKAQINGTDEIVEIYLKDCTKTITTTMIDSESSTTRNVMTVEGTFYIPEESEDEIMQIDDAESETEGGSKKDPTASVRATMTIEYLYKIDDRGDTWYLLENVAGNREILDNAMTISNKNVSYGCSSSLPPVTQSDMETNISEDDFDIPTGFDIYVCEKADGATVGAVMQVDIRRTSNTWTFPFSQYLVKDEME